MDDCDPGKEKRKKYWEPQVCLLNRPVNPAQFKPNWAGLAVLFMQIPNWLQDPWPSHFVTYFFWPLAGVMIDIRCIKI